MTRKYRLERTAFIGCRNTAYMDVDDAEPCPFCGSRYVTIYPYDKAVAIRIYSVVPFKDSLELQTLNPELKRPPQSFCYVQSELDLPMKG